MSVEPETAYCLQCSHALHDGARCGWKEYPIYGGIPRECVCGWQPETAPQTVEQARDRVLRLLDHYASDKWAQGHGAYGPMVGSLQELADATGRQVVQAIDVLADLARQRETRLEALERMVIDLLADLTTESVERARPAWGDNLTSLILRSVADLERATLGRGEVDG